MAEKEDPVGTRQAPGTGGRRTTTRFPFAPAPPVVHFVERLAGIRQELGAILEREIEEGRGFLWLPVAFGAGVLLYFALPSEPALPALIVLALLLVIATIRARRAIAAFRCLLIAATVVAGMAGIKGKTDQVTAPRIARDMTVTVSGWVAAEAETAKGGVRILLRVAAIEKVKPADLPRFVRITVRTRTSTLAVGDPISMKARLQPPAGPTMPGGYDFGRFAYYEGIGAVGYAYGAALPATLGPAPLSLRLWRPLEELRDLIRVRIEAALPGDNGRIAAALIMGDQGGISEKTQDDMRASGLGHVLSISGLHMALVAGSAFWLIRALLALSTTLALTRPIKKWAAAGGLAVAAFYLGISGGGVATDRSFVMLAIMLIAVMLDRRALTLRNVALAALVIVAMAPEAVLSASFQMSFAATVALVSAYEVIAARADRRLRLADTVGFGLGQRLWSGASGLVVTSLIAGLATAPFAAYHFHRLAPLSLLANLAAMPAVALLVMPFAMIAVLLIPFGLEALPLTVINWGLDWMKFVAARVAEWSAGAGGIQAAPLAALLLVAAGFLWLTLWRERWRYAGLVPIAGALLLTGSVPRPDILVAESGRTIAVRGADHRLHIAGGKGASFEVEAWLRADADTRSPDAPDLADSVGCDPWGCIATLADGRKVALVLQADAFAEDCIASAVVISHLVAPSGCAAETLVIDHDQLLRYGAHALRLKAREPASDPATKPTFLIETAYPAIHRPYMPPLPPALALSSGE